MSAEIRQGDALTLLREMPDGVVQTAVTSPPYFGLRCYGHDDQIGLEETPDAYVAKLVEVFREVRRVLRDDGTVWLNLGDSYASSPPGIKTAERYRASTLHGGRAQGMAKDGVIARESADKLDTSKLPGFKQKDLIGIPWRVAFALQADGWYLRSDIIWAKPNPMPESVRDRPTRSHEYIFMLSKSSRYYWDQEAVREDAEYGFSPGVGDRWRGVGSGNQDPQRGGYSVTPGEGGTRNIRSVWNIATQPYKEAHFATFPEKLVEPCILAGSSPKACGECGAPWERVVEREASEPQRENYLMARTGEARRDRGGVRAGGYYPGEGKTTGWQPSKLSQSRCCRRSLHSGSMGQSLVLDPFCGSGTVGVVALRHGRSFLGLELNPSYCQMAAYRISDDAPLLNVVEYAA